MSNPPFNIAEGNTFTSLSDAESRIQNEAKHCGFAVSRRDSNLKGTNTRRKPFCRWNCTKAGTYSDKRSKHNREDQHTELNENEEKNAKKRNRRCIKIDCEFTIKVVSEDGGNTWIVKKLVNSHNHLMEEGDAIYTLPQHRKPNEEQRSIIKTSLQVGGSPFLTMNLVNKISDDCPQLNVRDTTNEGRRIKETMNYGEKSESLDSLMNKLSAGGYVTKIEVDQENKMTHLFFYHPDCLKQLVKCNGVLLIDTTYRTNSFGYPLVNAVGMSNVSGDHFTAGKGYSLMNFQIALAWMEDETQASFRWFLAALKSMVYNVCGRLPYVIVTDKDRELTNAVEVVFPLFKPILCGWHLPIKGYSSGEFLYTYLAECQNTELAITAVHTDEEIWLYGHFAFIVCLIISL